MKEKINFSPLPSMSPSLSTPLLSKSYTRVRDLLDEARVIEDRKRDISYTHPRQQRGQPPRQPPRETTPLPTTRPTFKTDTKSSEKDISRNHASCFVRSSIKYSLVLCAYLPTLRFDSKLNHQQIRFFS